MIDDIVKDAEGRMAKAIESVKHELAKLRTGRAHPSLLEHVMVPYYEVDTPLSQVANVTVLDCKNLRCYPLGKANGWPNRKSHYDL